jgi:hypothetical protein
MIFMFFHYIAWELYIAYLDVTKLQNYLNFLDLNTIIFLTCVENVDKVI